METKEIRAVQTAVNIAIAQRNLKEAFEKLFPLLKELHDGDLIDKHYNLEFTYKSILKYAVDGLDDPQRPEIYKHVVVQLYALADEVVEKLLLKYSGEMAYNFKRELLSNTSLSLSVELAAVERVVDHQRLMALVDEQTTASSDEYNLLVARLFKFIWLSDSWSDDHKQSLRSIFASTHLPWHLQSLMCSAMFLSLMRSWNLALIIELFQLVNHSDARIRMRAMVNLLLVLYKYDARLDLFPEVEARLALMHDDELLVQQIQAVVVQLIRTRETEKISAKLQNEIIPEVMKMQSAIFKKLDLDNLVADSNDDKNPEWSEMFAESPQLLGKLEEISKWQMEGADVFLNTFQMLKHFPFFNEIHNWLLPFYVEHPTVKQAMVETSEALKQSRLFDNVSHSGFLCNSDKYSLFLSIPHMPAMQQQMLGQMFMAEMEQLNSEEKDELMVNPGKRDLSVSNQYVQDLYRFFKVYPQKRQFADVFAWRLDFYKKRFFGRLLSGDEPIRQMAEYLFKNNYHAEAIDLFVDLASRDAQNVELAQKVAFCYQKMGDVNKALQHFLKADILRPDNLWTLKKIARCYADLENFDQALAYYRKVAKIDPDHLQTHAAIGHCLLENGCFDEALKHFFKVEYLDANNTKVWRPIAWCSFVEGKHEQAAKYYHKLLLVKQDAVDLCGLGHVNICLGKVREALFYYRDAVRLTDGGFDAFYRSFMTDKPYLLGHGIQEADLAIYFDQIRYLLEE
jgi:tetratricopeptide (TPR) repeat protein